MELKHQQKLWFPIYTNKITHTHTQKLFWATFKIKKLQPQLYIVNEYLDIICFTNENTKED